MTTVNARTAVLPEETQEYLGKYQGMITLKVIKIKSVFCLFHLQIVFYLLITAENMDL